MTSHSCPPIQNGGAHLGNLQDSNQSVVFFRGIELYFAQVIYNKTDYFTNIVS